MESVNPRDFFQWQKDSRRRSLFFYLIFSLAAVAWFFVLYFGLIFISTLTLNKVHSMRSRIPRPTIAFQLKMVKPAIIVAVVLFAIYTLISSINRVLLIRERGSTFITTAMGGIPLGETETVLGGTAGPLRERILRNVVSEMCLAAGVSEPDIYILPHENGINALATGLGPDDAAIMLTKGALRYLTRDELSGLIGHELSHVINGDMRHNTLMAGWLHGFFSLTSIGYFLLAYLNRFYYLIPAAFFCIIIGFLGSLTGKLIQCAFNRRRESLADAYSIQFTRDPSCLARVLIKIGGLDEGSYIKSKRKAALECRHLYIAESLKSFFQTHPPIAERIWSLVPKWNGYWHDFEVEPIDFLAEKPQ
ncbi:MAG: M48 family metalloprotease [Deltaproteobacteria bacterium]|jgi:Zn-dependent protease with chaperone function|nr:M48 family metalloprotease [Deltaproteobacteria bacterium]